MFAWIESKLDVFRPGPAAAPPEHIWSFVWHFVRQVRPFLLVIFVANLAIAVFETVFILSIGWLIDLLDQSQPSSFLAEHGLVVLLIGLALAVGRPLIMFAANLVTNQMVVPQFTSLIRWQAHAHALGHSLNYFQGDFAGRIASRVMQSSTALREATVALVGETFYVVAYAVIAALALATTAGWLALPIVFWLLALGVLVVYFVPRARVRGKTAAASRATLLGLIVDSYSNILTVKLFARADAERSSVRDAIASETAASLDQIRLSTIAYFAMATISAAAFFGTAAIGVLQWTNGAVSTGTIAAALALVLRITALGGQLFGQARMVFENLGTIQDAIPALARPHDIADRPDAPRLRVTEGRISFDRVSFHYGREGGVIEDLSFDVRPGEKIGLVGPSGAGKSTIVNLLLRLYDVEAGRVLIDNQDIAGVTQDSLRSQIAVVTQDPSLLHRSIRDNIAYGRIGASETEIVEAARRANAHDFIVALEDQQGRRGYDVEVGERGVKLSGGQRQRIAIARVLLKNAPVLVLDEATSALDSEAEAAVQEQLGNLTTGRTVIAVAHRLSTIARLDRLLVIDGGRIIEQGTHQDLVARDGLYARLWNIQTGRFAPLGA